MSFIAEEQLLKFEERLDRSKRIFISSVFIIGAFVHFGWGAMYRVLYPHVNDPLIVRGTWSLICLFSFFLMYTKRLSTNNGWKVMCVLITWVNVYVTWVTGNADNSFPYVTGWTFTMLVTTILFPKLSWSVMLFAIDLVAMKLFLLDRPNTLIDDGMIWVLYLCYAPSALVLLHVRLSLVENLTKQNREVIKQGQIIEQERAKSFSAAKLASLSEMSSGVAHEINNPLAIITLANRKILRNPTDKDEVLKHANTVDRTLDRITNIVRSLKFLTNISENSTERELCPSEIVKRSTDLLQEKLFSTGVEIKFATKVDQKKVKGNGVELSQVVFNLVNNAIDALEDKDGEKNVIINTEEDGDNIRFSVLDNASKIPEETVESIFNPFFTTKDSASGTGLGLSTSKSIIEAHDGYLGLDQSGEYKSFYFLLPKSA